MVRIGEVRERLEKYLAGAESLEDFAYWLSRASSSIPYNADPELFDFVAAILNIVQVNFDGYLDRDSLQLELAKLRDPAEVKKISVEFVFDEAHPLVKPDDLRSVVNSLVASVSVAA
jgi:hypothetical protein